MLKLIENVELKELPKYILGYHKCTKDDAAKLAALILRVRFGESKSDIQRIFES